MTCSEPHSPSAWRGLHPHRRPGFFLLSEQSKAYYFPFYLSVLTSPAKAVLLTPVASVLAYVGDAEAEPLTSHCHSQGQSPKAQPIAS